MRYLAAGDPEHFESMKQSFENRRDAHIDAASGRMLTARVTAIRSRVIGGWVIWRV